MDSIRKSARSKSVTDYRKFSESGWQGILPSSGLTEEAVNQSEKTHQIPPSITATSSMASGGENETLSEVNAAGQVTVSQEHHSDLLAHAAEQQQMDELMDKSMSEIEDEILKADAEQQKMEADRNKKLKIMELMQKRKKNESLKNKMLLEDRIKAQTMERQGEQLFRVGDRITRQQDMAFDPVNTMDLAGQTNQTNEHVFMAGAPQRGSNRYQRDPTGSERMEFLGQLNMKDLRDIKDLNAAVDGQLRSLGLGNDDAEENPGLFQASGNLPGPAVGSNEILAAQNRGKSVKKSGITAKATDLVISPAKWPHTELLFEYLGGAVEFKDLNFAQFVAGEVEIIQNCTHADEIQGRLKLLQSIAYYHASYDWKTLLQLYATIMRLIEMKRMQWGEDTSRIEQIVFNRSMSNKNLKPKKGVSNTANSQPKLKDTTFFCRDFNRNKCNLAEQHAAQFKGQTITVHHICADCWLNEKKKLNHKECDPICPRYSIVKRD